MNATAILRRLGGDLAGGFAAAVVTLPQAIGYGVIAYAALGSGFASEAAIFGIYSAILAGFVAALTGGAAVQVTVPKAPLTLLLATVVAGIVSHPALANAGDQALYVIALSSLCVATCGVTQMCLGIFRLGNVVKYVPYPVVSGFMNGIAVLLVVNQVPPLVGVESGLAAVAAAPQQIEAGTAAVGVATLAVAWAARRWLPRLPAVLIAMLAGTAIYYTLRGAGISALGPTLGSVSFSLPQDLPLAHTGTLLDVPGIVDLIPGLVVSGIVLGLISSLQSLLSAVVTDDLTGRRHDSNRELLGQGLGNVCCAVFGALPAAGSLSRSVLNFQAGGRTRMSGMFCAGLILVFGYFAAPLIGHLPLTVIAAVVIAIGFGLVDDWTKKLVRKLLARSGQRSEILINLGVTLFVAVITISVNLVVAVGLGIALVSMLFMRRMSQSFIRRRVTGTTLRSRRMRSPADNEILQREGGRIVVIELQGALFFGSGDVLTLEFEHLMADADYFVLDMKRVSEVDSTGAKILLRLSHMVDNGGGQLLIAHLTEDHPIWPFLEVMDVVEAIGSGHFFRNTDIALEWCEERLLSQVAGNAGRTANLSLAEMSIARDLEADELTQLERCVRRECYADGAVIFRAGDEDYDLFLVIRGAVHIERRVDDHSQSERLITFAPGGMFGELALLDRQRRSADAIAAGETELYRLPYTEFADLRERCAPLAIKLLLSIGRETANNLRRTSQALVSLAAS